MKRTNIIVLVPALALFGAFLAYGQTGCSAIASSTRTCLPLHGAEADAKRR